MAAGASEVEMMVRITFASVPAMRTAMAAVAAQKVERILILEGNKVRARAPCKKAETVSPKFIGSASWISRPKFNPALNLNLKFY
jgi:hypothetical protein